MSDEALWAKIRTRLQKVKGPNGKGEYSALCPLHKDTVPSLSINLEQGWYCHGACQRGGSLTGLARELGILDGRPTERGQKKPMTAREAWAELKRRGLRQETIDHFQIDVDPEKKSWFWPVRGGRRYKKWPGYPGRKCWHYSGTPNKLYALGSSPKGTKAIYYVSGEVDLWVMWQAGLPATCHIFGEGNPPEDAGQELRSRGFREVLIVPDLDGAGENQTVQVAKTLKGHDLTIKVVSLPEYLGEKGDINDFYLWCETDDEKFRRAMQNLPTSEVADEPGLIFARSDIGNAERLVHHYGDKARYCALWKSWLIWDGRRWKRDDLGEIEWLARQVARKVTEEEKYTKPNEAELRKQLRNWANRCENQRARDNMLKTARSDPQIRAHPGQFNSDSWLLNVLNGTVDLRTGELKPHDQGDFITKLAPVEYDPGARLDLWNAFLQTATDGEEELVAYLQRAAGYTLAGHAGDEVVFFIHGPARTGKSTFIEAMKATLGDYAMTASFDTFLKRTSTGNPRPDIARLMGARLVTAVETERTGKALAEGILKALSGGDTICARHLYGREFEFLPIFAPWLAANYAPAIDHDDDALWERLKRIPFEHTIPREKRDPKVKATLRDPKVAGPAVLAWAIQGCLDWQRDGLGECPMVEAATSALREQMDPIGRFVIECCVAAEDSWVSSKELRQEYEDWARENGDRVLRGREWGESLRKQNCVPKMMKRKGKPVRGWQGVRLATDPDKQGALWGN